MIRKYHNHILQTRPRTQYGKETKKRKHYKQKNQEVSSFPTGEQNAARNRQDSMTDTHKTQKTKKHPHPKKHRRGTVS